MIGLLPDDCFGLLPTLKSNMSIEGKSLFLENLSGSLYKDVHKKAKASPFKLQSETKILEPNLTRVSSEGKLKKYNSDAEDTHYEEFDRLNPKKMTMTKIALRGLLLPLVAPLMIFRSMVENLFSFQTLFALPQSLMATSFITVIGLIIGGATGFYEGGPINLYPLIAIAVGIPGLVALFFGLLQGIFETMVWFLAGSKELRKYHRDIRQGERK